MTNDNELMRLIKQGDNAALESLVKRWYPKIFNYVFKHIGIEQDSYDLTQEVFVSLLKSISSYIPRRKFSSWIYKIAHNKCVDYFRIRLKNKYEEIESNTITECFSMEEKVISEQFIVKVFSNLSHSQKEAIILHYFYGYTASEISKMTSSPITTVKSRLYYGKKIISKYLQEE